MFNSRSILASVSLLALTACGASSNSAPVVYGTEPATGRIYNSPAEIYLEQQGGRGPTSLQRTGAPIQAQNQIQNRPDYQQSVYAQPVQSQAGLSQDGRQGVRIYNAPPSATVVQGQVQQAPVGRVLAQQTPIQQVPISGDPVRLGSYGETVVQQPVYRGLPDAPAYRNIPQRLSSTPTQLQSASPLVGGGTITVQPGDTVYALSRRTGYAPQDIINVNRMAPPYALSVGQQILLPVAGSTGAVANAVVRNDPYRAPVSNNVVSRSIAYSEPTISAPAISREVIARDVLYSVTPGDTLYSIARNNGVSVQSIANANRIGTPYTLTVGQQLLLPAVPVGQATRQSTYQATRPAQQLQARAVPQTVPANKNIESITREASYTKRTPVNPATQFSWPIKGSVIANYGAGGIGRRNDGINIAAPQGTTIRSAAAGEVVYRGSELDGYGNLLLIKHDGGYVTAYAHNDVMLVRKGQKVKKGAIIAKVGKTGAVSEPQLHFEIRQNLKSVDPLQFLTSN